MSALIDRGIVLDALDKIEEEVADGYGYMYEKWRKYIAEMPTQTNAESTQDLISRDAVIDLLKQMRKDGEMVPWEGKDVFARIRKLPATQPDVPDTNVGDTISRQAAIDEIDEWIKAFLEIGHKESAADARLIQDGIIQLPSAQPEITRCKDCKWWRQQTNYQGAPLSFGFCESDDMWLSLYGETYEVAHIDTDDDFYCGYAERRTDG